MEIFEPEPASPTPQAQKSSSYSAYTPSSLAPEASQQSSSRQTSPSQSSSRQSPGGGINRGINSINKLMRGGLKNPLGKLGSRIAAQTIRGFAAFLTGPGLPFVVAICSILIFVLIVILGFGGTISPKFESQPPTPTPAAP